MQRTSNGSFLASLPDIRRQSGSPRTLMPVLNGPQGAPVRRAVAAAWGAFSSARDTFCPRAATTFTHQEVGAAALERAQVAQRV